MISGSMKAIEWGMLILRSIFKEPHIILKYKEKYHGFIREGLMAGCFEA